MRIKEMELTKEQEEAIRGSVAITLRGEFNYTPLAFREAFPNDTALWPVFVLKGQDGLESATSEDGMTAREISSDGKIAWTTRSGSIRVQTLRMGIRKINGLPIGDGETLDFEIDDKASEYYTGTLTIGRSVRKGVDVREVIRYLRPALQIELSNAIVDYDRIESENERGL